MTVPALELKNIYYRYPKTDRWGLENIDLQVPRDSLLVMAGPTGSGKSTLLKIARGLHKEYGGEFQGNISVMGEDVTDLSASDLGSRIAIVFQNPSYQLHQPRVIDEIMSAPIYQGLPWQQCLELAQNSTIGILSDDLLEKDPTALSLGQQQTVALAASLSMNADVVLLDEPFSYLDTRATQEFLQTVLKLRAKGKTVVLATHDLEPVVSIADRIVLISGGQIVLQGNPETVLYSAKAKTLFGRLPFVEIGERLFEMGLVQKRTLNWQGLHNIAVPVKAHDKSESTLNPAQNYKNLPVIEILDTSYIYPNGSIGVRDLSLQVLRGEILGLIGSNGCGKTTLARLMLGLIKPSRGRILVMGEEPKRVSSLARKVGYVTQNPTDMLFETTVYKECSFGPISLGIEGSEERVQVVLSSLGLLESAQRDPHSLSGGEQRLLSLADVLVNDPQVLILDEPEFGLDPKTYHAIRVKIRDLRNEGRSIVLITHNLETAAFLCDRIALMKSGRILRVASTADILENQTLLEEADLRYLPFLAIWKSLVREKGELVDEGTFISKISNQWSSRAKENV